jgi:predicted ABC-type transport system involved in lysophospholipase L1 biosynthesis ATPase subunit
MYFTDGLLTHDIAFADGTDRVIEMEDGRIVSS